jgi:two-component system cell cycle sensor histidine kinase/response regulator CckA
VTLEDSLSAILGGTAAGERVILLVEDEAPVRAFAARALELQGYKVLEADTAETALSQLEDPALKVDLFVTDVVMPGMDGPSWVAQARRTRPGVAAVFMSGYADGMLADDGAVPENAVLLPKPFSLEELAQTVRTQLG